MQQGEGLMRKIYDTRWKKIDSRDAGKEAVLSEKFAYFDDSLPLELIAMNSCDFAVLFLPEKYGIVWVTQKNSFLNKLLQH